MPSPIHSFGQPMSSVLELVIGLVFVYLLLSFVCLAINEGIATVFHMRARNMRTGVSSLLLGPTRKWEQSDLELAKKFYAHPLIKSLNERATFWFNDPKIPSYIPARTFTLTLIDLIREHTPDTSQAKATDVIGDTRALRQAIKDSSVPDDLKKQIITLIDEASGDFDRAKMAIDRWFDDGMERLSAVYKQRIHLIGLVVAIVVAFAVNADTLRMARELSTNSAVRAAIAAEATQFAQHSGTTLTTAINDARTKSDSANARPDSVFGSTLRLLSSAESAGLPLGFAKFPATKADSASVFTAFRHRTAFYAGEIFHNLVGLMITAFAISLGAPFWFDMLNKVVNVRSAGRSPEERPKSPAVLPAAQA